MSRRDEKDAMKIIREKHERKYGAPLGKRSCKYGVSEDCLRVGAEYKKGVLQWRGHKCVPCLWLQHRELYDKRKSATKKKSGTKSKHKRG